MTPAHALPGFLAVAQASAPEFTHWGVEPLAADAATLVLSRVVRDGAGAVDGTHIAEAMRDDPAVLTGLLPPFAAVRAERDRVVAVADSMGFRQLYHSSPGGQGVGVLSTSALEAGRAAGAALDEKALAVQSLLGWQLGRRTVYAGIDKLDAGATAVLAAGGVEVQPASEPPAAPITLDDAVEQAALLLQQSLGRLLDEHPDAVLQLTGGQDSRILLSAIPPARRRGVRAMTLGVPGGGDVEVAGRLASLCGLAHEVHGLGDAAALDPADAWERCRTAARRLDAMSDPVALAALGVAEEQFAQGVRISGLGGEVARGFYYVGRVRDRPFGPADARRLAQWRMFVNEAVEPGALDRDFASWGRDHADRAVYDALAGGGSEWFRATDHLYLRHRMARWAGVTDTAVGFDRVVINPMLDESFLRIAGRLAPRDKAHSLFLARLQLRLDPELGRLPLEGRPAPFAYATRGRIAASARTAATTATKASRKVLQRVRRANRAPAGGGVLAAKVVEHWRRHPEILDSAPVRKFVDSDWIEAVIGGEIAPRPSSVAFLSTLVVLGEAGG